MEATIGNDPMIPDYESGGIPVYLSRHILELAWVEGVEPIASGFGDHGATITLHP